jgi:hypothetical protein
LSPRNKGPTETDLSRTKLRDALLSAVPAIVEAAVSAIERGGPNLGYPAEALEKNLRIGLADAVDGWLGTSPPAPNTGLHFALGQAQARAGRSLDELMSFYRIAGQTAWRRLTELGTAQQMDPQELYRLAETGFGYVDELSTQAAAGFADEQSLQSGASHSRRSELVRLLMQEPQAEPGVLEAAAAACSVKLSATLAAFVGAGTQFDSFARASTEQFVLEPHDGTFLGVLFDPDGPGRRGQLLRVCERAEVTVALGPGVHYTNACESLRRARSLFTLLRGGSIDDGPLVDAERHDLALFLSAEPLLARQLVSRRLAPLNGVRAAKARANLALTLRAWLANPGQRKQIAYVLGVHPQTVRYRMSRLREIFGATLDDPDSRFELELALRLERYAQLSEDVEHPEGGAAGERVA